MRSRTQQGQRKKFGHTNLRKPELRGTRVKGCHSSKQYSQNDMDDIRK